LNNPKFLRNIKKELIRKRNEIETMKNMDKTKALESYAEFLVNLEIDTLDVR